MAKELASIEEITDAELMAVTEDGGSDLILDVSKDSEIASSVMDALDAEGYSAEEAIAGLILGVLLLAERTRNADQALDEAADLLLERLDLGQ